MSIQEAVLGCVVSASAAWFFVTLIKEWSK